jgi:pyrroline-5-carboxylate reductase
MTPNLPPRLAIIGAGRMGGALMTTWAVNYPALQTREIIALDPAYCAKELAGRLGCRYGRHPGEAETGALDTAVIGVRAPHLIDVAEQWANHLPPGVLLISIVAGVRISRLQELFPTARVVRAIPNTPAALGLGATAFIAASNVSDGQRDRARTLLEAGGIVEEVAREELLDAVVAMSGSGPAYLYCLAEAMAEAGVKEGLPRDMAQRLAHATVTGAGLMLSQSGEDATRLRAEITSPGGTTEAALGVLRGSNGLYKIIEEAIATAAWRAEEMGKRLSIDLDAARHQPADDPRGGDDDDDPDCDERMDVRPAAE